MQLKRSFRSSLFPRSAFILSCFWSFCSFRNLYVFELEPIESMFFYLKFHLLSFNILLFPLFTSIREVFVFQILQVFSFEDGPVESVWSTIGLSVRILPTTTIQETTIDWLK